MATKNPYIVHLTFIRWTAHGGGRRTHHTHRQHKKTSKPPGGSDKPPGKQYSYPIYNAKFISDFSRSEFGVYRYARFERVHISGVGCRDPPINRFENFKND